MNLTLRLVGVELPRALAPREPYVTAIPLSSSSTGRVPIAVAGREVPAEGAAKAPATVVPAIETAPAASVNRWHPLKLDVVLFEGDPGDWLLVRGTVMESDADFRRAGARIDAARHAVEGTQLASALAVGIGRAGVSAVLADEAAKIVGGILGSAGDDLLLDWEIRLEGVEAYRAKASADGGAFAIENGKCRALFSFAAEGLPAVAVEVKAEAKPETKDEAKVEPDLAEVAEVLKPSPDGVPGSAVASEEPVPIEGAVEPRELAPGEVLAEADQPANGRRKKGEGAGS